MQQEKKLSHTHARTLLPTINGVFLCVCTANAIVLWEAQHLSFRAIAISVKQYDAPPSSPRRRLFVNLLAYRKNQLLYYSHATLSFLTSFLAVLPFRVRVFSFPGYGQLPLRW